MSLKYDVAGVGNAIVDVIASVDDRFLLNHRIAKGGKLILYHGTSDPAIPANRSLEFYKDLYKCCTAPGMTNAYMQEGLDAFKSGQVAMQMNWFAFFPGLYKDPNVGGDKIGFFVNPSDKGKGVVKASKALNLESQSGQWKTSGKIELKAKSVTLDAPAGAKVEAKGGGV